MIVMVAVLELEEQPATVTTLVTVYVPGVLLLKVTAPVVELIVNPAGVAVNVPAVEPLPNVIVAVPPFEQYGVPV